MITLNVWCCGLLECANYVSAPPGRSPTNGIGGTFVSSGGVRGRQRKATGQKNINSKQNEQSVINILHWNAEGVSNRKEELQEFLHENNGSSGQSAIVSPL
jgi:phosphohistidine swiveling domain-containing protein